MKNQKGGAPGLFEYTVLVILASALYFVCNSMYVLWR